MKKEPTTGRAPGPARDELRRLAGKRIEAREEERRRLGRELHDDLSQRLAALAIDSQVLRRALGPDVGTSPLGEGLERLIRQLRALAEDVRRLSHRLNPGTLESLGLAPALEALAAELEGSRGFRVELSVEGGVQPLPPAVALCLFRAAEEALFNAARHSGAGRAQVTLRRLAGEVRLEVADGGDGFDPAQAPGDGVGLVDLRERVRLLGGRLDVASAPGAGTRVEVALPLEP